MPMKRSVLTSCAMMAEGNIADRKSGVTGSLVTGWSAGEGATGLSAAMLYQHFGNSDWGRSKRVWVDIFSSKDEMNGREEVKKQQHSSLCGDECCSSVVPPRLSQLQKRNPDECIRVASFTRFRYGKENYDTISPVNGDHSGKGYSANFSPSNSEVHSSVPSGQVFT